jgi:uncharacterized protein YcgI (DUF1989 family)
MTQSTTIHAPPDAAARRAAKPVTVYALDQLPAYDAAFYEHVRAGMTKVSELTIPPRDARAFEVPAGHVFRIVSIEGPQVGDLNLWNAHDLTERFYSGKTRALHSSHVTTGDRLWSSIPNFRPMATVTHDTLAWYGRDDDGAAVHDILGTRCDPYSNVAIKGVSYDNCCHSNLTRALVTERGLSAAEAELLVHDVVNVFMCTGLMVDTHRFFMKSSPVRPGDYFEVFAEIDLLAGISTCPGGDCGAGHSSDVAPCYPLKIEIYSPADDALTGWQSPQPNAYNRSHGLT